MSNGWSDSHTFTFSMSPGSVEPSMSNSMVVCGFGVGSGDGVMWLNSLWVDEMSAAVLALGEATRPTFGVLWSLDPEVLALRSLYSLEPG